MVSVLILNIIPDLLIIFKGTLGLIHVDFSFEFLILTIIY